MKKEGKTKPKYIRVLETPGFLIDYFDLKLSKPALAEKYGVSIVTIHNALNCDQFKEIEKNLVVSVEKQIEKISDNLIEVLSAWSERLADRNKNKTKKGKFDKDEVTNALRTLSRINKHFKEKVQHTTIDDDGNDTGIEVNINFTKIDDGNKEES